MFIVQILLSVIVQYARVSVAKVQLGFDFIEYWRFVISYILRVSLISPVLPCVLYFLGPRDIWYNLLIIILSAACVLFTSYFIGLTAGEKIYIQKKVKSILKGIR